MADGAQQVEPAGREQAAAALPHWLSQARRKHAERRELALCVRDERDIPEVDERQKLRGVVFDLPLSERDDAVELTVFAVDETEDLGDPGLQLPLAFEVHNPEAATGEQPVTDTSHARLLGRLHSDDVLRPVSLLFKAIALHEFRVIGEVVIGDEHAVALESVDEHALFIQVTEADRADDLA